MSTSIAIIGAGADRPCACHQLRARRRRRAHREPRRPGFACQGRSARRLRACVDHGASARRRHRDLRDPVHHRESKKPCTKRPRGGGASSSMRRTPSTSRPSRRPTSAASRRPTWCPTRCPARAWCKGLQHAAGQRTSPLILRKVTASACSSSSGDDAAANRDVAALIERLGFAATVLGKIEEGGRLQQFGGVLTNLDLGLRPLAR